jgi:O-antigen/teichoic acid export membrane protein
VTPQLDQTKPRGRLRDRILKASAWTLSSYCFELSVRLFSNLVLARLLFPEAFGEIAAAMALIVGLALISDFGVEVIIVQSPYGDQADFLRSAWVFQFLRGLAVWIGLIVCCFLIEIPAIRRLIPTESVFASRTLPVITAVLGSMIVLSGAESTCIAMNARLLNYRPIIIINLISKLLSLPITLVWAWIAPSVWPLVGGALAGSIFRLMLSHMMVPGPRMSLTWDRDHFRAIVRFGRWIMVSSFASFIGQQSDVILLGLLVPGSVLGLYAIAKLIAATGEGLFERLSSSLALPIFGEVFRKDPGNLRDRYYRFRLPIELASGLISGGLFAAGNFVISFLYDTRYEQAGIMLQILALGLLSLPLSIIGNAFLATGDTHISAVSSILKAIALIGSMLIGFFSFGVLGAIGGVALHRVISSAAIALVAHRRDWIWVWYELRILPAFIVGLIIGKGFVLVAAELGIQNIHQFLHFSSSHH